VTIDECTPIVGGGLCEEAKGAWRRAYDAVVNAKDVQGGLSLRDWFNDRHPANVAVTERLAEFQQAWKQRKAACPRR